MSSTGLYQIQKEPTYSDLLGFICRTFPVEVNYLEIGVSVGKNFLQMASHVGRMTGLDVEDMSPAIAAYFPSRELTWISDRTYPVETLRGTMAEITMSTHKLSEAAQYIKGDQFSPDTWEKLRGESFNLIFSDGVHSAHALRNELENLLCRDLIPRHGPFLMYWDDLINIEMQTGFYDNARQLQERFGPKSWFGLHWIHGTYGSRRLNGLFSSLPL